MGGRGLFNHGRAARSAFLLRARPAPPLASPVALPLFLDATDWLWERPGTCVTQVVNTEILEWLTLTGWELFADNWANPITCQQTTSRSTTLYGNIPFCFFDITFTAYEPNEVNGQWDGTLVGFFNDSAFGSFCSSFLTIGFRFERTLN